MVRKPFFHIMQTAKGRLIMVVTALALVLGLSLSVAYISAKQSLEKQVIQNAISLVDVLKFSIENLLYQSQMSLNLLAANAEIFSEHCDEELSRLMQNELLKHQYTGFAVLSSKGEVKCSTYGKLNDRLILDKMDIYKQAVSKRQFSVGSFRLDELSHSYIIPVGLPVELDNGSMSVLSAALKVATFQGMFNNLPLPEYAAAFLIDSSGTVMAAKHSHGQAFWQTKKVDQSALFKKMKEGHVGSSKGLGLDQVQRLYAFERLSMNGQQQYLLVTFEEGAVLSRFFGRVNAAVAISAGVVTMAGLLLLITVYFLFVRQVEQLVRFADVIIKDLSWSNEVVSDSNTRSDWTHTQEINQVSRSLKLVRSKLDERTHDLYQTQKIAKIFSWKYRPELAEFSFSEGIDVVLPELMPTSLLSANFLRCLPDEDSQLLTDNLHALFASNVSFKLVIRVSAEQEFNTVSMRYLEVQGEPALSLFGNETSYLGTIQDITESMLLRDELEHSEKFLQAVLDNLGESVVACDAKGELKVFNSVTQSLHGLPLKQIPLTEAPRYYSLYTEDGKRILHPEEMPLFRAFAGHVFKDELIRIAPDQLPYRIVRVRGQSIKDNSGKVLGAVVVQEDITAERAAESRIRQSEEEFRLVFEAALDGLVVVDENGIILLANQSIAKLHGYTQQELLGHNFSLLVQGLDWDGVRDVRNATCNNMQSQEQLTTIHRNGQSLSVEVVTSRISLRGQKAFLYIIRDTRERKMVEERINSLQRIESVGRLTGGIAHDFNNLLQVIIMNLDIIECELEDRADLQEMVQAALKAACKGGDLTKYLLAFTRQQTLKIELVEVHQLIDSCRGFLDAVAGQNLQLKIGGDDQPKWAYLDKEKFEAAMIQLVMNAKDAIEGRGEISITVTKLSLSQPLMLAGAELKAGEYCQVVIKDNGSGMSEETRLRAFEPFFTTKKMNQGSGLGLSMVYGFVQQSGGGIEITSQLGEGTEVTLYIPTA